MLPYSTQLIDDDDINAVLSALKGEFITQGAKVDEFERQIADFVGVKYAVCFNSATSALNVAYKIVKCDLANHSAIKGDSRDKIEFLTTPLTFCATANMMVENGIVPKFCAINEMGNIDENNLQISPNIKAIVSVDYAGNSVEVEKIAKICAENNLYFISDSSHSFGGASNGRKIGAFADMTIFSFHAVKPITTIEGGAITTNNELFYKWAKLLRSHCIAKTELWDSEIMGAESMKNAESDKIAESSTLDSAFIGHNFRLSDIAASLGISQLKKLPSFLAKRHQIAQIYDDAFKGESKLRTLQIPAHIYSTYHLYPILLDSALVPHKKAIFRALLDAGLGVQVHYKPIYRFAPYQNHAPIKSADDFYNAEISIPCHQKMSANDADFVISAIRKILAKF
ncbi:DegT/DnrJ/EryC1/StrS family aminotransferase [Helicobacter sp. 23-1044]